MSVSDTDREEAITALVSGSDGCICVFHARGAVERLIALGWGPGVPVPTRDEIARAIHDGPNAQAQYRNAGIKEHAWASCPYRAEYLADADAVLALFSPVEGNTK